MRRLSTAVPCRSKGLHTRENVQLNGQLAKQKLNLHNMHVRCLQTPKSETLNTLESSGGRVVPQPES